MNRIFLTIKDSSLWRLLTRPLRESLGCIENYQWMSGECNRLRRIKRTDADAVEEYKRRYLELDSENAELRRQLRMHRTGAVNGVSWRFDCHKCKQGIYQDAEPITRWIEGKSMLLCPMCAEKNPQHPTCGTTQRRPLRGEVA